MGYICAYYINNHLLTDRVINHAMVDVDYHQYSLAYLQLHCFNEFEMQGRATK